MCLAVVWGGESVVWTTLLTRRFFLPPQMRPLRVLAAAARGDVALMRSHQPERTPSTEVYDSVGSGDLYWPKSAQEYIAQVPPLEVEDNQVRCDGGGGALGHPAIFINLNRGVNACGYCGLRFVQKEHHH